MDPLRVASCKRHKRQWRQRRQWAAWRVEAINEQAARVNEGRVPGRMARGERQNDMAGRAGICNPGYATSVGPPLPFYRISCLSPHFPYQPLSPTPTMPPSPTSKAPKSLDELKELLKDDTMVKVAGQSPYPGFRVSTPRRPGAADTKASTSTASSAARS